MACPSCSPPATIWIERSRRPHSCRLPFGGDDPAAIGAGLGAIDPLRVSQLCREVTSWRVSQHRTIVLDSIHSNAFSVPQITLAFNRPNYHTVKLHCPPEPLTGGSPGFVTGFPSPPDPPSAHPPPTPDPIRLVARKGRDISLFFDQKTGDQQARHQYIAPFFTQSP